MNPPPPPPPPAQCLLLHTSLSSLSDPYSSPTAPNQPQTSDLRPPEAPEERRGACCRQICARHLHLCLPQLPGLGLPGAAKDKPDHRPSPLSLCPASPSLFPCLTRLAIRPSAADMGREHCGLEIDVLWPAGHHGGDLRAWAPCSLPPRHGGRRCKRKARGRQ